MKSQISLPTVISIMSSIEQYPELSSISIEEPTPLFSAAILLRKTGYHSQPMENLIELISKNTKIGE